MCTVSLQVILFDEDGSSFAVDVHDAHRINGNGMNGEIGPSLQRLTDDENTGELPSVGGV